MFKRIDHLALQVKNLVQSIDFYQQNFGFEKYFEHVVQNNTRIAYLKLGNTVLELFQKSESVEPGFSRNFHFCIETSDFEAAVTWLTEQQLTVAMPPHDTPARHDAELGWRRATFLGPDGEEIEIRG